MTIFWGSSEHTSDSSRKERTVNTWAELCTKLDGLDLENPETAYTVVITSYQTWASRTTKSKQKGKVTSQVCSPSLPMILIVLEVIYL